MQEAFFTNTSEEVIVKQISCRGCVHFKYVFTLHIMQARMQQRHIRQSYKGGSARVMA